MNNDVSSKYTSVDASPVKSFFVSMLTRDIQLEEAILDLLDNCVDGILRSFDTTSTRPYEGFKADITFGPDEFLISDNCGGIPWKLHDYAFRMGRSPSRTLDAPGSVGVYGIGMKRAIFKIGRHCLISTRNAGDQYEVEVTPEWISNENSWDIPVRESHQATDYDGTAIYIGELYPSISQTFGDASKSFNSALIRMIATHYAYIIDKGFEVTVNGASVKPRSARIVYDHEENGRSNIINHSSSRPTPTASKCFWRSDSPARSLPRASSRMNRRQPDIRPSMQAGPCYAMTELFSIAIGLN